MYLKLILAHPLEIKPLIFDVLKIGDELTETYVQDGKTKFMEWSLTASSAIDPLMLIIDQAYKDKKEAIHVKVTKVKSTNKYAIIRAD